MNLYMHPVATTCRPVRLFIAESGIPYLADKIGSPAYPRDPKERAKVNEMMDWINTNFYRDFGYGLCYPQLFPHLKRRRLRILDNHWLDSTKHFLCGHQITIADYFGACLVSLGHAIKADFAAYPNVKPWLDNVAKLPNWAKINEAFFGLVDSVGGQSFVSIP